MPKSEPMAVINRFGIDHLLEFNSVGLNGAVKYYFEAMQENRAVFFSIWAYIIIIISHTDI